MSADAELHTPEAHDVIACELTACVLGQRERVELRVDFAGRLAAITRAFADLQRQIGMRLLEAMGRIQ